MSSDAIKHTEGGALTDLMNKLLEQAGPGDPQKLFSTLRGDMDMAYMIEQCGRIAQEHGFWDAHAEMAKNILEDQGRYHPDIVEEMSKARLLGDPTIFLALIMTECGEAIEAYRAGNMVGKDGVYEELADVVIRLFDFIARFGPGDGVNAVEFTELIAAKMAKNESRPRLHGKTF